MTDQASTPNSKPQTDTAQSLDRAGVVPATPAAPDDGILKRNNRYFADVKVICRRPGFNVRFDFGEIARLAGQIKDEKERDPSSGGLMNDLRVKRITKEDPRYAKGFRFEIIDGDRRLTAIESLMQEGEVFPVGVPVKIVDKDQSELNDLLQMFIANEGKPFLPLEEAVAYQRMRDAGMTVKEICAAVGRAQVHVVATLALANADESLKLAVAEGRIGKSAAKDIAVNARNDKELQAKLTADAVAAESQGDKSAKRAVRRQIEEAKVTKAIKRGVQRVPKMRALSDEELSQLGKSVADRMPKLIKDANAMKYQEALDVWVAQDEKLALAFAFGALQALKAAAGLRVKLDL